IKARYWVRGLADPNDKSKENKYWLEAVPKSRVDAQNFKSVQIVLDKEEYLPESLVIFAPNFDPPRNNAKQTYVFSNRKTQDDIRKPIAGGLDPLKLFHRLLRSRDSVRLEEGRAKQHRRDSGPAAASRPRAAAAATAPFAALGLGRRYRCEF